MSKDEDRVQMNPALRPPRRNRRMQVKPDGERIAPAPADRLPVFGKKCIGSLQPVAGSRQFEVPLMDDAKSLDIAVMARAHDGSAVLLPSLDRHA